MNPGEKCICQYPDWYNAFGDVVHKLEVGQRLTFKQRRTIGGMAFYYFEETPDDVCFLATGFKPLRSLN